MKTGLFGGSFDPIHIGHLILAREAREQLGLDRVIFIPAAISPHKLHREPAPAEARLEMVRAAVEGEACFEVEDCELGREGPSFTIDTVRWLRERHPADAFFYFIGEDNLALLHTWREIDELRRLVQFVVLARDASAVACEFPRVCRQIDVSSTEVRKRVARGQSIRYLLPQHACEVILRNGLYRMSKTEPVKRVRKPAAKPAKAAPKRPKNAAKPKMDEAEKLARACAGAAADKKAEDIQIIDLRGISDFTDFFIVCSGTSDPQLKAIAGGIRARVREEFNSGALSEDGASASRWVVIDFAQVIVHVFHQEARSFYMLEDLWGDAPRIPFEEPAPPKK